MSKKPDADEIRHLLSELPTSAGLGDARRWWPKYVYRSDHVANAARILESGRLLSRAAAERDALITVDAARPDLIAQLVPGDRDLVRLYFRPQTPTQYCNEGVRPRPRIELGAHMPVPVYFLFDAKEVLTETGVKFSRGRLVPGAARGHTAGFLATLDFLKVYHSGGVGRVGEYSDRGEILNARNSEVLVPGFLALDHLRLVVCRSAPERDTLLALLSPKVRVQWRDKVVLEGARSIFCKRATFVTDLALESDQTRVSFYTQTLGPEWRGPFEFEATWDDGQGWTKTKTIPEFVAPTTPLVLQLPRRLARYDFRLTLDGNLVCMGSFTEATGPSVL